MPRGSPRANRRPATGQRPRPRSRNRFPEPPHPCERLTAIQTLAPMTAPISAPRFQCVGLTALDRAFDTATVGVTGAEMPARRLARYWAWSAVGVTNASVRGKRERDARERSSSHVRSPLGKRPPIRAPGTPPMSDPPTTAMRTSDGVIESPIPASERQDQQRPDRRARDESDLPSTSCSRFAPSGSWLNQRAPLAPRCRRGGRHGIARRAPSG